MDSERNSYTLIQGQVAGSNAGQYIKTSKKRTDNVRSVGQIPDAEGILITATEWRQGLRWMGIHPGKA